jgi:pentatricopeptide repeat protein
MPAKNLIVWTAMINGYAQAGQPKAALALFRELEAAGIEPADAATMVGVISTASQMSSKELAGWIGAYVDRKRIERNEKVLTALVDMHAKCGNVEQTLSDCCYLLGRSHNQMPIHTLHLLVGWRHMDMLSRPFKYLKGCRLRPDPITFVAVLTVCSHTGLLFFAIAAIQGLSIRDWSIGRQW